MTNMAPNHGLQVRHVGIIKKDLGNQGYLGLEYW